MKQEEKAKAYDEALERARDYYDYTDSVADAELIKLIFPELKESEDDKIRKNCIHFLELQKSHHAATFEIDECIAWLEKQEGCEYIKKDLLEHIKQSWYKEGFIDGKYSGGTSKEWTINDAATLKELIDFLENRTAKLQHDLTRYANWLKIQFTPIEKQGEQKPVNDTDEDIVEAVKDTSILDLVEPKFKVGDKVYALRNRFECTIESIDETTYYGDTTNFDIKDQNNWELVEQKPFDYENANIQQKDFAPKVEPKFENGQWIVWQDKCYKVNYNGCGYELFDQNGLSTSWGYKAVEDNAHLWTIQDAKNGDVLASKDGIDILIFRRLDSSVSFSSYYNIRGEEELGWSNNSFILATKEQRDLLFSKMKETGYEWDAEKKKLKKIEDYIRQKLAWSEEDERTYKSVLYAFEHNFPLNHEQQKFVKSLKDNVQPHNRWKPSEEQMHDLKQAINTFPYETDYLELLYDDLKKLREE